MARYGLAIEKTFAWRGIQHPFANVYYYKALVGATEDNASLEALMDQIVAKEKTMHSTLVTFTRARLWITGTGSRETNVMRVQKQLSGTGSRFTEGGLYRECAYLIQWPAGVDSRHRPVKLRKWYHTDSNLASTSAITDAVKKGEIAIPAGDQTTINTNAEPLFMPVVPGVGGFVLCAQSGREATASGKVHRFIEHHQLGDQWRG